MRTPGATAERTGPRVRNAAVRLFAQKGFAAVGVRELARAAELTSASLYHYMGAKEDLLVDIMRSTIEPLITAGDRALAAYDSPEAQLAALAGVHVWMHGTEPEATLVADTELRALSGRREREMIALRDRYQGLWRSVVRAGVGEGTFDVTDESIAVIALLDLCNGVSHWYAPAGRLALLDVCAVHADLALAMVRAQRDGHPVRTEAMTLQHPEWLLGTAPNH